MKKNLVLFPLLASFALCGLASCNGGSVEQVAIEFGKLFNEEKTSEADHFKIIDHATLTSKISYEDDFALLVYKKNDTCGCWINQFRPNIYKYLKDSNLMLYAINYAEFNEGADKFGLTISSSQQTIGIFKDGKLTHSRTRNGDDDPWAIDYATFSSWMNDRIRVSNNYYVDKEQMEGLYEGELPFTIGWFRDSCGDCGYINRHAFKEWGKESHQYNLYLFDCDDPTVRPMDEDGHLDSVTWQAFKDKYGMSEANNLDYGFNGGYVPTFHYVDPTMDRTSPAACVKDACVVFNDTIDQKEDGTYYVADTFYTEEREDKLAFLDMVGNNTTKILKDITLTADDVNVYPEYGNYIEWKHESAEKYHNPLMKAFLDYYL